MGAHGTVLAEPHVVTILNDEQLEHYGLDRLTEVARANLRRHLPQMMINVQVCGGTYIVTGDEHTATMALEFPALVERVTGAVPSGATVLAMPCENTLLFHSSEDSHRLLLVLDHVEKLAWQLHDASGQPLSPHAYGWTPDGLLGVGPMAETPADTGTAQLPESSPGADSRA